VLLVECSRFADAAPRLAHVVDTSSRQPDFDHDTASLAARWLAHTRRMLREESGDE
jgi:hypothetical protein